MKEKPGWLTGILSKRTPDAIRVLMDLLEAARKNGECSANDVRQVDFDEPNVIGATFGVLKKFGLRHTERRVKTTARRKHSRRVDVWELEDRSKVERVLLACRTILCGSEIDVTKQLNFWS